MRKWVRIKRIMKIKIQTKQKSVAAWNAQEFKCKSVNILNCKIRLPLSVVSPGVHYAGLPVGQVSSVSPASDKSECRTWKWKRFRLNIWDVSVLLQKEKIWNSFQIRYRSCICKTYSFEQNTIKWRKLNYSKEYA